MLLEHKGKSPIFMKLDACGRALSANPVTSYVTEFDKTKLFTHPFMTLKHHNST